MNAPDARRAAAADVAYEDGNYARNDGQSAFCSPRAKTEDERHAYAGFNRDYAMQRPIRERDFGDVSCVECGDHFGDGELVYPSRNGALHTGCHLDQWLRKFGTRPASDEQVAS